MSDVINRRGGTAKPSPFGNVSPRIATPSLGKTGEWQAVAEFAEALNMPLLDWQLEVFKRGLQLTDEGKWAHNEVCVCVARQQGKTHLVRMRILAGLFVFGEKSLVGTAQDRALARATLEGLADVIESHDHLRDQLAPNGIRMANGSERIKLKTGAEYRVVAPTPRAARGYSNDFVFIDELREQEDELLWAAIRPTINARKGATARGPQVWMTSNAGHAESVVLLKKREQARQIIESGQASPLCYLEWSAPEDAALDSEEAWAAANPALGRLIELEDIRAARESQSEEMFRTEQLCQFVDTMQGFLPAGTWDGLEERGLLIPDEARGQVFFGIDRAPSGEHGAVVAVWPADDGRLWVEVVKEWDAGASDDSVIDFMAEVSARWRPRAWCGDEGLLKDVFDRFQHATGYEVHRIRGADRARAASAFYQAAVNKRIAHNGDVLLSDHLSAAARREVGDAWYLSRRHSSRHIDAAIALVSAVHAASLNPGSSGVQVPTRHTA